MYHMPHFLHKTKNLVETNGEIFIHILMALFSSAIFTTYQKKQLHKAWGTDTDKTTNHSNTFSFHALGSVGFGKRDDTLLDLWKADGDSGDEEGAFCYLVINTTYGN